MFRVIAAFAGGGSALIIAALLFIQIFIPDLTHVPISKIIWIVLFVIGGILGVGIQSLMDTPFTGHSKKTTDYLSQRYDIATLMKNKDQIMGELNSDDAPTRAEAITKLAAFKDLDFVPLFFSGLHDTDQMVRLRATEALSWVTGKDFGEDESQWIEWWSQME
jgi:hypothetical protein